MILAEMRPCEPNQVSFLKDGMMVVHPVTPVFGELATWDILDLLKVT